MLVVCLLGADSASEIMVVPRSSHYSLRLSRILHSSFDPCVCALDGT